MIDISRDSINHIEHKTHFIKNNIEKMLRIVNILEGLFSSEWKDMLALRGGTAINLFYSKLSRLSIDIDLDFTVLTKDEMVSKRDQFRMYLNEWMAANGYYNSNKNKSLHAIDSFSFKYTTKAESDDNIKIEIDYLNRTHVFSPHLMDLDVFDYVSPVKINVCDKYDIYGSKLAALIGRTAPRDAFDIYTLIEQQKDNFDLSLLRKCFVLYRCIGSKLNSNISFNYATKLSRFDCFKELMPYLHKASNFDNEKAQNEISGFFSDYMQLNDEEERFVSEFKDGYFNPKELFGYNDISVRLGWHPAAFTKCRNSDDFQQKRTLATYIRMQGRGEDSLKGLFCLDLLEKVKKQYGEDNTFKDLYYGEDVFPAERDNERGLMYRISICSDRDDATLSFFKSSGRYDSKKPDEYYIEILNDCKSIRSSGKSLPQTDNNSNNLDKGGPAK